jgi:hypothetical protein
LKETSKRHCRGIVGGDFNMLENPSYKCFACGRMLLRRKRMVWEASKIALNVEKTSSIL